LRYRFGGARIDGRVGWAGGPGIQWDGRSLLNGIECAKVGA